MDMITVECPNCGSTVEMRRGFSDTCTCGEIVVDWSWDDGDILVIPEDDDAE